MRTIQDLMFGLIKPLDGYTEQFFGEGESKTYSLNVYTDKSFTIVAYDNSTEDAIIIFNSEGMPTLEFLNNFDINDFAYWSIEILVREIKAYLKYLEAETAKEVADDPTLNDL